MSSVNKTSPCEASASIKILFKFSVFPEIVAHLMALILEKIQVMVILM